MNHVVNCCFSFRIRRDDHKMYVFSTPLQLLAIVDRFLVRVSSLGISFPTILTRNTNYIRRLITYDFISISHSMGRCHDP